MRFLVTGAAGFVGAHIARQLLRQGHSVSIIVRPEAKLERLSDCVELSATKMNYVYVPKGFAHGYCTLTDESVVLYKVDSRYTPEAEGGILWNDPDLAITWPADHPLLSPKDQKWPMLREFATPFA